jgi:hypothetical protein
MPGWTPTPADAKLVVLLRDPVMRAMSHWNMVRVMRGHDGIPDFDKEVEKELELMRAKECSFEAEAGGAVPGNSAAAWSRDPSIPSWNKCFRCEFMWCGTYNGPANASTVSCSRVAIAVVCGEGSLCPPCGPQKCTRLIALGWNSAFRRRKRHAATATRRTRKRGWCAAGCTCTSWSGG